ncbi:MAG: hypothetical protein AAGA32_22730, partial [Pseudomonadota bacterium]
SGVRVRNANSELFFPWTAFDRWIPIRGGTVLVFRGPWGLGVPDTALPDGLTVEAFRQQVDALKVFG